MNTENKLNMLIPDIKKFIESGKDYEILRKKTKQAGISLYSLHKLIEKMKDIMPSYNTDFTGFIGKEAGSCGNSEKEKELELTNVEINNKKLIEKKKRKNWLIYILVVSALIVFLSSFSVLQKDIKNLINETNQLRQSNDSLNKELTNARSIISHIIAERDSLINRIHADTLTGFDINTIKTNGYDANYIMWLSADSPLTLESVTTKSDKPGRITIRLHSPDDKIICTKDIDINKKEATIRAVLNFTIPEKGDYYLSFTSINNVNLCYTTTNGKYVFPTTGCLKITGWSPNDNDKNKNRNSKNYYQYFYNVVYRNH